MRILSTCRRKKYTSMERLINLHGLSFDCDGKGSGKRFACVQQLRVEFSLRNHVNWFVVGLQTELRQQADRMRTNRRAEEIHPLLSRSAHLCIRVNLLINLPEGCGDLNRFFSNSTL